LIPSDYKNNLYLDLGNEASINRKNTRPDKFDFSRSCLVFPSAILYYFTHLQWAAARRWVRWVIQRLIHTWASLDKPVRTCPRIQPATMPTMTNDHRLFVVVVGLVRIYLTIGSVKLWNGCAALLYLPPVEPRLPSHICHFSTVRHHGEFINARTVNPLQYAEFSIIDDMFLPFLCLDNNALREEVVEKESYLRYFLVCESMSHLFASRDETCGQAHGEIAL